MPGCIGIQPDLTIRLLENVCSEIARNGLKKIVIVNSHGGNDHLIHYFAQIQLAIRATMSSMWPNRPMSLKTPATAAQWETTVDGHAGERETSMILAIRPELVRTETLPADGEGMPQERLKPLRDLGTDMGIWWYADHPTHYCGDGRPATAEKGERWLADRAQALAKIIRAIKVRYRNQATAG